MKITFPEKKEDIAELKIDGSPVNYKIPPVIGTHSECFAGSNYPEGIARATGRELVAYIHGALVHRKNEWADPSRIKFPTLNYARVGKVLTIIPKTKKFGDLEGAMIIDVDSEGEGIAMKTAVPTDLSGWESTEGGRILQRDNRIVVPYDKWYTSEWDEDNGAAIGILDGRENVVSLVKTAQNSGRSRPLWKVDPANITTPERRVPVVCGYYSNRLCLYCCYIGYHLDGCAVRVRK